MSMLTSLRSILNVTSMDKIISIKEESLADANFILTNLMKQFLSEENSKVCLVIMHNTLGHYQYVGKKLGYDLLNKIQSGSVTTIEPLNMMVDELDEDDTTPRIHFLSPNKENIVKELFLEIKTKIDGLLKNGDKVYLILDDISHLADLGVNVQLIIHFLNYLATLVNNAGVTIVVNCHVSNETDELISNALGHVADLNVDVCTLKTGMSHNVGGVIKIRRPGVYMQSGPNIKKFHYKAFDRGIQVFAPGSSILYLPR